MKLYQDFDEKAFQALDILLEQFWILREDEPEKYQLIRDREHALRMFFIQHFNFRFIVHQHFIKLEKIPSYPESWMGIQDFGSPQDYVMFCCLLAYLEEKQNDEQFILSGLCDDLKSLYPEGTRLNWENIEHRRSLVRVMKFTEKMGMIETVEGSIDSYASDENNDVLYNIHLVCRYFVRPFPKELRKAASVEDMINSEWSHKGEETPLERKQRLYRQIFLSPAVLLKEAGRADFEYLREHHERIKEHIEQYTPYQFELYADTAMLVVEEPNYEKDLFPKKHTLSDIVLQLAGLLRGRYENGDLQLQNGLLYLTEVELEGYVNRCKDDFGQGWSKAYRESSIRKITQEVIAFLHEWKMASWDEETSLITILPTMARIEGSYSAEFNKERDAS